MLCGSIHAQEVHMDGTTPRRVLVTTTSFQDTQGRHHDLLAESGWQVEYERGPLSEAYLLSLPAQYDGLICGDDRLSARAIDHLTPQLEFVSKYGVGLDSIDINYLVENGVRLAFTPGVNADSVAELTILAVLSALRHYATSVWETRGGTWKRRTGHELTGRHVGIVGLGSVGKAVAHRMSAMGCAVTGYDPMLDEGDKPQAALELTDNLERLLRESDIVTLHAPLVAETEGMINARTLDLMKDDAVLVNNARGSLVDEKAVAEALRAGTLGHYCADVLTEEPMPKGHVLQALEAASITPHIGSRTSEAVERQAVMAVNNLSRMFGGDAPLAEPNQSKKVFDSIS
jgi:D-3-phosphoglycerate dehydrogenase